MPYSKIRPEIPEIADTENKSPIEAFQNTVLRPILKMQHDLLVIHFKNASVVKKSKIHEMKVEKREALIDKLLQNDHRFKAEVKGMVLGGMTVEEYEIYLKEASEFNRRIFTMIAERIKSVYRN